MQEDALNQTWWNRLRGVPRIAWRRPPDLSRLLDPGTFARALQREWSRGQRIGLPLALVIIEERECGPADLQLVSERLDGGVLPRLAGVLFKRIRCTDILGWREPGKLGVILPHTTGRNAWQFVNDALSMAQRELDGIVPDQLVEIHVFAYPLGE